MLKYRGTKIVLGEKIPGMCGKKIVLLNKMTKALKIGDEKNIYQRLGKRKWVLDNIKVKTKSREWDREVFFRVYFLEHFYVYSKTEWTV